MKYCGRDFQSVDDMNEELIYQHNKIVKKDDIVYNLGDFTFRSVQGAVEVLKRLNGRHRFIRGNHDEWLFDKHNNNFDAFRSIQDELIRQGSYKEKVEWVKDYYEFRENGQLYCLMHFPLYTWHHSYKGSMHLYGHTHASIEHHRPTGRQMDVGVDNAKILTGDYRPFSLEEVNQLLLKRGIACPEMEQIQKDPWDKEGNHHS